MDASLLISEGDNLKSLKDLHHDHHLLGQSQATNINKTSKRSSLDSCFMKMQKDLDEGMTT